MNKFCPIVSFLLLITIGCNAENIQVEPSTLIDPSLNQKQNQYLDDQAEALLAHASKVLLTYPPAWPEPAARRSALFLLDAIFHDVYAPQRTPVQIFFKTQMQRAVEEIENTEITTGARIWKMYNHGFVIKTKSVTIGFDLICGKSTRVEEFLMSNHHMDRLIQQCDLLFISHHHGDHADKWVAQSFINQGKTVVAPPDVWNDQPIHKLITHLKRIPNEVQQLPIQDGKQILDVIVYPGHQGNDITNNVTLVNTPENLSFLHMGDQFNFDDLNWIDKAGEGRHIDVLIPNCWTMDIVRVVHGFNPSIVITGHENELGHTIDHREPYWLTYQRREGSDRFGGSRDVGYDTPLILMTWGESYHYEQAP